MNFTSLRFRYSVIFAVNALLLILVSLIGFNVGKSTSHNLLTVEEKILPALAAVLNADRDLYQARVAELEALEADEKDYQSLFENYQENAQQAKDRMQKFNDLLSDYPDSTQGLESFTQRFNRWMKDSTQVFTLLKANNKKQAIALSKDQSLHSFEDLRGLYDHATEAAEALAELIEDESNEAVDSQLSALTIVASIAVVLSILLAYFGPKILTESITRITDRINDISQGDGDLSQRLEIQRKDEIGELASSFNQFVDLLEGLIGNVNQYSKELSSSIEGISQKSEQTTEVSKEQNQSVEMIAAAVTQMAAAIREVANNANQAAEEVNSVNAQTEQGQTITKQSVEHITLLSNTVQEASNVVESLSQDSDRIASVLDVIRGIAEQTNLLALNAAIEAARAGEQGRGFAVVADEVRNLASKTQQSTEDIQKMIEALQNGVMQAVEAINKGTSVAEGTVDLANQTLEALNQILESTSKVADVSVATATSTEQQTHVTEDIDRNLNELADKTKINLENSSESLADAKVALQQAESLNQQLNRFKISS
ncbi:MULTISPECIES: methyl-accepting chemotaxis protein [unclassified Agarivorans]|uniref:methyl-accepting chemotaxis protein n=1 Tax=unclassified Agarivorans TaxID=2636026 RepID=UPI0026E3BD92|nr:MULTISPECIES: methyl-accepting chemotaxis protein [unclassified Agarivorans]MDO6684594.1 methyl-accepting chemotaxis protein [Agarivorans sp. 3_MG-2023]MDO6714759.1 methyl-accepting chemotaxis protein [Agarivorans sp. 2_MG-2023]